MCVCVCEHFKNEYESVPCVILNGPNGNNQFCALVNQMDLVYIVFFFCIYADYDVNENGSDTHNILPTWTASNNGYLIFRVLVTFNLVYTNVRLSEEIR